VEFKQILLTKNRRFYVVGVSHKTAAIDHRGYFSLSDSQLHALFLDAKEKGIQDLLLINTCNRTEIYAWTFSDT